MAKESYYLRHNFNQGLYVYLEIGETWEDSFFMEFRITETKSHWIKTGSLDENRRILLEFKDSALTSPKEITRDKKLEWKTIHPDAQLEYVTRTFIESYVKNKTADKS
jgi:hypothetical protein